MSTAQRMKLSAMAMLHQSSEASTWRAHCALRLVLSRGAARPPNRVSDSPDGERRFAGRGGERAGAARNERLDGLHGMDGSAMGDSAACELVGREGSTMFKADV